MSSMFIASSSALGAVPVVFVSFLAVIVLLCVRAWCGVMAVTLSRLVSSMLDGSIVVLFVLFLFLVVVRFVTVG